MKTYKLIAYHNVSQQHSIVAFIDAIPALKILLICFLTVTFSLTQQTTSENSTNHHYFKVKPTDIQVIEGHVAELQCQISANSGAGPVQWSKDGFLLGFDRIIPGYNRYLMIVDEDKLIYNLRIHNTQIDDEAEFECQTQIGPLYGNKQPIRASANLHLIVPPKSLTINGSKSIEGQNPSQSSGSHSSNLFVVEAKEGEKIVLICLASQSKPPPKLKWFRKNTELLSEAAKTSVNKSLVNNRHILYTMESFLTLYPKAEEEYRCQAEHPGLLRPLRATVIINIFKAPNAPVIDGYKNGDIVNFQEKLTLKCVSSNGYPPPSVVWLRNGVEIDRSFVVTARNEVINTLTFVVTAADNSAQYTCQASNPLTPIPLKETITLSVLFLPTKITIIGPKEVRLIESRGTTINLKCTAHPASPPPFDTKLKWFVDGNEVSSGDEQVEVIKRDRSSWIVSSNLTFTITRRDPNMKTFMCTGFTSALKEESVSAIHKVNVIYAPDLPTLLGIKEGSAVVVAGTILKCKCVCYSGNPRASLVWLNQEDREISAITSITGSGVSTELVIRPEPKDNGHIFRCKVIHPALDEPLQVSFRLTVYYPPERVSIVFPPFIKANDTIKIECITSASNPAAVITLLKNGKNMIDQSEERLYNNGSDAQNNQNNNNAKWGKITKSVSTIVASVEDNESVITCLATNPVISEGVARADEVLSVYFKPQFESWRSHLELNEFENKVVNLSANANPRVDKYHWKRVKKVQSNSGHIASNDLMSLSLDKFEEFEEITKNSIQAHGSVLYVSNISRSDSGLYVCIAANKIGESRAFLGINVFYSASIVNLKLITQHDSALPREGDSYFQLHCKVDSNPSSKLKWRKEDSDRKESIDWFRAKLTEEEPKFAPRHQLSILTIFNISRLDAGIYTCYTSADVKQILVNIKFKPKIIANQLKIAADIGEAISVKFICLANAYPYVHFNWSINTADIGSTNKYEIQRPSVEENSYTFKSELIIHSINEKDFKSYKCLAYNDLGSDEMHFELVKKNFPESPTNLRTINVSRNSVLIGWDPGFDSGYEQSFRIRYWKVTSKQINVQPSQYKYAIVNNTLNKILITNLESDSDYQFSISSRNKLGESLMSRQFLTVKTLPNISKRKLETVLASADEQKLGYNNKLISDEIIELSVIISLLVLMSFTIFSVVICCYKKRKAKLAQKRVKRKSSKDISTANSGEERPFFISTSSTLDSSCHFETALLQQHQQDEDKCLFVEKDCSDFDTNKLTTNFMYKTQPDILIINQPFAQMNDQCLEDDQNYCDNEMRLNELEMDPNINIDCDECNVQTQQKPKRVNIIKPVLSAYSLSTLNEEEEIL